MAKKGKYSLLSANEIKKKYMQANCRLVMTAPFREAIHIISNPHKEVWQYNL